MTTYIALIYTPDMDFNQSGAAEMGAEYAEFGQAAAAVLRGGNALHSTATATTVRVSGGKGGDVLTTDGPYAETKEVLSGYYVLECADLEEAVKTAARIPAAWNGGAVEIRPVVTFA
ncbi:YciI family protein [Kutzneria sp. 744]|uniref:YciI family protein n=1 Tax=Kutzneria sp. (strain 744) TaxID=345341 RepID=UPI0003EECD21|nr:YciI family protein [Kutzneria sp. 744]EWM13462.1 DGPF domain protein [Kutzneria sp. 744]